jgi:hypothetical protein
MGEHRGTGDADIETTDNKVALESHLRATRELDDRADGTRGRNLATSHNNDTTITREMQRKRKQKRTRAASA